MRLRSSEESEPSPSSNRQILNLLTPDKRANLLCETPRAIRLPRRFSAAVVELSTLRSCHAEALALNLGALAKMRANVGDLWEG